MKAPEKLYITNDEKRFSDKCHSASTEKYVDDDIEYIRADALIEKACKFIKDKGNFYIDIINGQLVLKKGIIKDFKKYMKGEKI